MVLLSREREGLLASKSPQWADFEQPKAIESNPPSAPDLKIWAVDQMALAHTRPLRPLAVPGPGVGSGPGIGSDDPPRFGLVAGRGGRNKSQTTQGGKEHQRDEEEAGKSAPSVHGFTGSRWDGRGIMLWGVLIPFSYQKHIQCIEYFPTKISIFIDCISTSGVD